MAAQGLVGTDLANGRVEQGHRVGQAIHAEDAGHAQQRHAAAELQDLRADALGGGDRRLVVVLFLQAALALFAGVGLGDVLQGRGDDRGRLVVRHADPLVAGPLEVLARRRAVGLAREAGIEPLLEAGADHALVDAAVAVEPPRQGKSLLADARIPAVAAGGCRPGRSPRRSASSARCA